jgi:tetratricopeptide (TPR) repeat protein
MSSRFLIGLEAQIETTTDRVSVDCLHARRASYFARQGRFDEASEIVLRLHAEYDGNRNARISSWLNLVEGLVIFFRSMSIDALDKFRRANVLAVAANFSPMIALSAGWIAHFEFGRLEVEVMKARLEQSFQYAVNSDHDALARSSLVCAVALHISGRYDLARSWYEKARVHAIAEGDDATVSAIMHNITSMAVMLLRQSVLTGTATQDESLDALLGANSTTNYDQLVGAISLSSLVPVLRANILSLRGYSKEALSLYLENINAAQAQGMDRMLAWMRADIAWCHLRAGDSDSALSEASLALKSLEVNTHVDDRAATHTRLAQVYGGLEVTDLAEMHQSLANSAWHQFSALQERFLAAVGGFSTQNC